MAPKSYVKADRLSMKFFWNPNISVHRCLIQNLFFFCPLLSKDISNTRSGLSKWCRLPPLPFKISLKDTSFHISINSLGLYLSPRMLIDFSLKSLYSTKTGKNFQIYGVHILRKFIESRHFYPLPNQSRGKLLIFPLQSQFRL